MNEKQVMLLQYIRKEIRSSDPSNQRPISLTSIICKLMASIITDHIMEFFFMNSYFSNKQYGFIKGRSTVLQLLTRARQQLRWATVATIHMGLKEGRGDVPLSRSAGNLSNTMLPAPMSTAVPSGVFIHPAVWPQQCRMPLAAYEYQYQLLLTL